MHISSTTLSEKLAQISLKLKPFQSLAYDPSNNTVTLITECLVPILALDELSRIVQGRHDDDQLIVKRYTDQFKVTFSRSIAL